MSINTSSLIAQHASSISRSRCAACGGELGATYYSLPDRPDYYCSSCIATRPRCSSCSAPLGDQHWRLHDGRLQCGRCHATAIYDAYEAEELYRFTLGAIVAQLGLLLTQPIAFQLIDMPAMADLRQKSSQPHSADEQVLGLYYQHGYERAIYMLHGLPKLLFRTVVAHEYAHAWQAEACPNLRDEGLREGFAEWVAYRHLSYLGCVKAAQQMLRAQHPYRPFLEHMLEREQREGPMGVMRYVSRV